MLRTKKLDIAERLKTPEMIAEYLNAVIEDGDTDTLLVALQNVCRARGMTAIAQQAGLGRESLYKALTPGSKPQYETIAKVMSSLGIKLKVEVSEQPKAA